MQINKLLTPYNHNEGIVDRIKYIVIHYVGATGGAVANCKWYAGADRSASAHYYVDFDGSVWQSVEDKNIAWVIQVCRCVMAGWRLMESGTGSMLQGS